MIHTQLDARSISGKEFKLFQSLIHRETGIFLSDQKRALLVGRLAPRMRELSIASFAAYYELLLNDRAHLTLMIDSICTNETSFFREPRQFEFLCNETIPQWRSAAEREGRRRNVRVWSAACSTGEEPYSIAMLLAAELPDWSTEILATDISTKVLRRAADGIWPIERAEQISPAYRKRFMLRGSGSQEGKMAAKPELTSLIRFDQLNLNDEPLPAIGRFDLIFCRNVLIYFDAPSKRKIIDKLLDRLEPGGLLFLGHSESLNGHERVRPVGPTVYALREKA